MEGRLNDRSQMAIGFDRGLERLEKLFKYDIMIKVSKGRVLAYERCFLGYRY